MISFVFSIVANGHFRFNRAGKWYDYTQNIAGYSGGNDVMNGN